MDDATVSAGVSFGAPPAHWVTDGAARLVPLLWRTMADREKIGRMERFIGSRLDDWSRLNDLAVASPENRWLLADESVGGASMYESISGFERICPVAREEHDVRTKMRGGLVGQPPLPEGELCEALWDRVVVREVSALYLPVYLPSGGLRPTLMAVLTRKRRRGRGSCSTTC